MSRAPRYAVFALLAILSAGLGALVARWSGSPESTATALRLESPRALPEFSLRDHHGSPFGPERLAGRWTFMFFGFTNCPDVCPSTLFTLGEAVGRLQDLPERDRPKVVMVSVDPNRDTIEKLAAYVPHFHPGFLGVTGETPQILSLTQGVGVAFAYSPLAGSEGGYTVDHTASIFLVDPAGRLAAIFSTPHVADTIAADYRLILGARG